MTNRRRAARLRGARSLADLAREPTLYRLHLWDRLPREMIASCMWSECARLARDWVDAHRAEIDEVVARFERGEIAGDVMLDELCERARAWAHAASGIDFLENDPCPY